LLKSFWTWGISWGKEAKQKKRQGVADQQQWTIGAQNRQMLRTTHKKAKRRPHIRGRRHGKTVVGLWSKIRRCDKTRIIFGTKVVKILEIVENL